MSRPKATCESIFRDRRSPQNAKAVRPVICRRKRTRKGSDERPWWLKVDYVSQQADPSK